MSAEGHARAACPKPPSAGRWHRRACEAIWCCPEPRPPQAPHQPGSMSYLLPHLHSGFAVDQAILSEEDRVVVIRFGCALLGLWLLMPSPRGHPPQPLHASCGHRASAPGLSPQLPGRTHTLTHLAAQGMPPDLMRPWPAAASPPLQPPHCCSPRPTRTAGTTTMLCACRWTRSWPLWRSA